MKVCLHEKAHKNTILHSNKNLNVLLADWDIISILFSFNCMFISISVGSYCAQRYMWIKTLYRRIFKKLLQVRKICNGITLYMNLILLKSWLHLWTF